MIGRRVFNDSSAGCNPRADEFKSMVVEVMALAGVFNIGDFIPALEFLDLKGVQAKMKKLHKRFDEFLSSIIEEHKACKNEKHNDILSTLLSLKDVQDDGGTRLTDTEIKALLLNLFTAGTDTSSSTAERAIAELIRHPRMLAQSPGRCGGPRSTRDRTGLAQPPILAGRGEVNVPAPPINATFSTTNGRQKLTWICAGAGLGLRMVQLLIATLGHAFDWSLADGLQHEKLDEDYGLTLQRAGPDFHDKPTNTNNQHPNLSLFTNWPQPLRLRGFQQREEHHLLQWIVDTPFLVYLY